MPDNNTFRGGRRGNKKKNYRELYVIINNKSIDSKISRKIIRNVKMAEN